MEHFVLIDRFVDRSIKYYGASRNNMSAYHQRGFHIGAPRGAHRLLFLVRICLLLGLLFSIFLGARRAVAAWYFRQRSPDAIRTAIRWDPANPDYYDALGTTMHLYANGANTSEIVQLYQRAARLSPHDAYFWADLGAGYDWAGRSNDALEALQHAQRLFPNSPDINWKVANFYVRARKIPEALRTLRMVLLEDATAQERVFTLATNATGDREAILKMLPPQTQLFFGYLQFQIARGDFLAVEEIWARILQLNLPFDLPSAFPYLDALIQHREVGKLVETWSAMADRFPTQIRRLPSHSNLITNGSFSLDILNGGLDWRVVPEGGAIVDMDSANASGGTRALRITFDGSRNPDYGHVFQYVPVQPNTRYHFSASMRVKGITTDSGPRFQACDAYDVSRVFMSTENLIGTSDWLSQQADFTTKADTHLLLIRVARPLSGRFDNQIAGTLWISGVWLSAE
jgi:hypothetical protein